MKTKTYDILKSIFIVLCVVTACAALISKAHAEEATDLPITVTNSNGQPANNVRDNSYKTAVGYKAGDTITITSETPMQGIYVIWSANKKVSPWTLTVGDKTIECGKNGFIHEYVDFGTEATSCTMKLTAESSILKINAYSKGDLPVDVQKWEPACEKADVLVISAHSDDEILFMGGVLAQYAGQDNLYVQVIYLCQYLQGPNALPLREHEKLDGIWHSGVKNYPLNMDYQDLYTRDLQSALKLYDLEKVTGSVVENIRRFKPQVIVTHDFNGEYGHGGHMILSKATADAVERSMNADQFPESANTYGVFDVPKTYIHLYAEKPLTMDLRQPLSNMRGKTALEIAKESYLKHESQQWCSFKVDDEYKYSCAKFGLLRTTVGDDTGKNDMMENITSYVEQDRIAAEKAEAEAKLTEAAQAELTKEAEAKITEAAPNASTHDAITKENKSGSKVTIILIVFILIIVAIVGAFVVYRQKQLNARKRELELKRRRNPAARRSPNSTAPRSPRPTSSQSSVQRRPGERSSSSISRSSSDRTGVTRTSSSRTTDARPKRDPRNNPRAGRMK